MPTEPGRADLPARWFQMAMKQIVSPRGFPSRVWNTRASSVSCPQVGDATASAPRGEPSTLGVQVIVNGYFAQGSNFPPVSCILLSPLIHAS